MGTQNIPQRANGNVIDQSWFNLLEDCLAVDIVPRDSSGNVNDAANGGGSLGSTTYRWLRAYIASGYWDLGDIKTHYSYNGAAPVGEGWMLCDGRQITLANYDTEHGSGHFALYVVTSALLNKYLPNFTGDTYETGASTTTQDGTAPITTVGNASNTINIQHVHTGGLSSNTDLWMQGNATTTPDQTYGSSVLGLTALVQGATKNSISLLCGNTSTIGLVSGTLGTPRTGDLDPTKLQTSGGTLALNSSLSTTQDIRPLSIRVLKYMRVVA